MNGKRIFEGDSNLKKYTHTWLGFLIVFLFIGTVQADQRTIGRDVARIHISKNELESYPSRSLRDILLYQPGISKENGELYLQGRPLGEMSIYIDGTYYDKLNNIGITSVIPFSAIQEIIVYPHIQSAKQFSGNSGRIDIISLLSSERMVVSTDYLEGVGKSGAGLSNTLYSYGNRQYSFSLGGPLSKNINFLASYENKQTDDISSTTASHYSMNRHEFGIDWTKLQPLMNDDNETYYSGQLWSDGEYISDIEYIFGPALSRELEELLSEYYGSQYDIIHSGSQYYDPSTPLIFSGYNNFQESYGAKANTPFESSMLFGKLNFRLEDFSSQVGVLSQKQTEKVYYHDFSLINSMNNPRFEHEQFLAYFKLDYDITPSSQIKLSLTYYQQESEFGDHHYWSDIKSYGNSDEYYRYHRYPGLNPLPMNDMASFSAYGTVWDGYSKSELNRLELNSIITKQIENHQLSIGLDIKKHIYKKYAVDRPVRLEYEQRNFDEYTSDIDVFASYKNAFTENIGYDILGNDNRYGNSYQPSAQPEEFFVFLQDQFQLKSVRIDVGLQIHHLNMNTNAPKDWQNLYMTNGEIDRLLSEYSPVETHTHYNPRLLLSESLSEKVDIYFHYGKYSQMQDLSNVYLSDTRLATIITSGHILWNVPNPKLRPEIMSQTGLGIKLNTDLFATIDLDYSMSETNHIAEEDVVLGNLDGAEFVWNHLVDRYSRKVHSINSLLVTQTFVGIQIKLNYNFNKITYTTSGFNPYAGFHAGSNRLDYYLSELITGIDIIFPKRIKLFQDMKISMLLNYKPGVLYNTASTGYSSVYSYFVPYDLNNYARTAATFNLNLMISKTLLLKQFEVKVFCFANNLTNEMAPISVYASTGTACDDGWFETDPGKHYLELYPNFKKYYDARIRNPVFYSTPRSIQIGLSIELL